MITKDVDPIYELPLILHQEGLDEIIVKYLHLSSRQRPDFSEWGNISSPKSEIPAWR